MLRKTVMAIVATLGLVTAVMSFHNTLAQYVCWAYMFPLLLSIIAGDNKGRWVLGFWLGFFLLWIGFIITLLLPASQNHKLSTTHRECPHCKEMMRKDATVCPHCQRDVSLP